MPDYLIDTSFLVALTFPKDRYHLSAAQAIPSLKGNLLVAAPVVTEFLFVARKTYGYKIVIRELQKVLSSSLQIIEPTHEDYRRAVAIMHQYMDSEIDLADAVQVALAERRQITRICTFDRRDFSLFRPTHCDYFELTP